ncbi:SIR2 family protein [Stieleria sp. ICT_E10.1]|uniref:SIR2 family protein n=1 Tax=Stieleria sedimenti TaxID=2976331 RepID=UPI0021805BFE|nr:SIR2 family protein [Stieleria sedimenti]MCS7466461.1 SIR2 family protein [Stieleria sedimenti]
MTTHDSDRLQSALEHAKAGNAVLFLGAGYSTEAKNRLGKQIPLARELRNAMAQLAECDSDLSLETIAEFFKETQSPDDYIQFFESRLRCTEVTDELLEIAKVPWLRVYTTNYDDVYEFSSRKVGIDVKTIRLSDSTEDANTQIQQIVHINGAIEGFSLSTIGSLRLTHSSYAVDSFLDSPWIEVFRSDLATARAIVFCGYSMVDIDIRKVVADNETMKEKLNIVVYPEESGPSIRTLERYGAVYPIGVEGLGNTLKATEWRARSSPAVFGSFERQSSFSPGTGKLSDRDAFALFCYGKIDQSHIWRHQREVVDTPLLVRRSGLNQAIAALKESTSDVVVHGHLASGKSVLLNQIAATDFGPNWEVFRLKNERFRWREEVREICKSNGRTIVLIDNFPQHMEVVKEFALHRKPMLSLVLGARSNDFDVRIPGTEEYLRDYLEVDISLLTKEEADDLKSIFEHYGFHGRLASLRSGKALERLADETGLQMHSILLWIFNSEDVKARIDAEAGRVFENDAAKHVLITGLILSLINVNADGDLIFDFGPRLRTKFNVEAKQLVSSFIDHASGEFNARSSVLARHILSEVLDPNELLESLKSICKKSVERSKFGFASENFRRIPRELCKFSNQISMFPAPETHGCIIEFFEFSKSFDRLRTDIQFWLQYAIARTSMEHFGEAGQLFDTTYELVGRQSFHYDTRFIDNHYARFLILRAMRARYSDDRFTDVEKAIDLLSDQMRKPDANKHYPYKVASMVVDYFHTHQKMISEERKSKLADFARFALNQIPGLIERVGKHFNVKECEGRFTEFLASHLDQA